MSLIIIIRIFSLTRNWSKHVVLLKIPQLILGNIQLILPSFQNCTCFEKYLKDNKHHSLHEAQKYMYAQIVVLEHYVFLVAHSFPRAMLLKNCSLLGTDNVRRQISLYIFTWNGGYCLFNLKLSNSHLRCNDCVSNGLKINNLWLLISLCCFHFWHPFSAIVLFFIFYKIMQWNSTRSYHLGIISINSFLPLYFIISLPLLVTMNFNQMRQYQSWKMVVSHHISKQQQESWKFDVQWHTFDKALRVWRCDKLLSWVFASSETETNLKEKIE